jgi:hypothetical protein
VGNNSALTSDHFYGKTVRCRGLAPMHHYAFCNDETVIQIHGTGPFDITYINAGDDPRTKNGK